MRRVVRAQRLGARNRYGKSLARQHFCECIWGKIGERSDRNVCRKHSLTANPDAAHPGAPGSLHASGGVFHNDALPRRRCQARRCRQKYLRIRLARGYVFRRDDGLKASSQANHLQYDLDVRPGRGRSNGLAPLFLMQSADPFGRAG